MLKAINQKSILSYIVMIIVPLMGLAGGVGFGFALGVNGKPASDLLANVGFLLGVGSLIPIFKFSAEEMGLKLKSSEMGFHVGAALTIFLGYMLFYIFVIRISSLKPINSAVILSLLTYLLVVFAKKYISVVRFIALLKNGFQHGLPWWSQRYCLACFTQTRDCAA